MSRTLKLAIQKSGRLSEKSQELLRECGISYSSYSVKLTTLATNFPLEILFLRDDDIPGYVEDGVADIGVIGENVLLEAGSKVDVIEKLGFAKCRLSLAIPNGVEYKGLSHFEGKKIATSYPNILQGFFKTKGINASTHKISGSVEIAPNIGLADAICDIVSTGSTLKSNGLKEVDSVISSQAVLIGTMNLAKEKVATLKELLFRMESVRSAQNKKYVMMNVPQSAVEAVSKLLPGVKSPTIVNLANDGWVSVQPVVSEEDFWKVIGDIKKLGAEDILVTPIEKMIE